MLLFMLAAMAGPEDKLIALDRRIQAAMVANDVSVLKRSIADDFRFTHSDGSVETKADLLRTAALKPRYYLRRRVLSAKAEVHERLGFVFGILDVASGPRPEDAQGTSAVCYRLNYVHAFERRGGTWRLTSHSTTKMTQPERPCITARQRQLFHPLPTLGRNGMHIRWR